MAVHPQPPVGVQPGPGGGGPAGQWMPAPPGNANCPPGLEYLTQIDQLLVMQQVELLEVFTTWETANRYQILNGQGQRVYFAAEESGACERQICGPKRGFTMHITDNAGQEVIRLNREFKCFAGPSYCACIDCCAMEVSIEAPVGTIVGYVKQACSPLPPKYTILDANQTEVLKIEGPLCICHGVLAVCDQNFEVMNLEDTGIGTISKKYAGMLKEMFTDADNFGVTFPVDLDVKIKAIMIGAVFLIDFMYFEKKAGHDG